MDWLDPGRYVFDPPLTREEWAWQFLRRNPEYWADYAWFIATWRALEADYGTPPERDYFRWKQDPRAWRSEREIEDCPADTCPGIGDRVLIECWMGAKWGLRKFPPDPGLERPLPDEQLAWREVDLHVRELDGDEAAAWLQQQPGRICLGFDLGLPLAAQLEHARRNLLARRHALERTGTLPGHRLVALEPSMRRWLRLLDGERARATPEELRQVVLDDASASDLAEALRRAHRLVRADYRRLLLLED